jgi:hypothetical protein
MHAMRQAYEEERRKPRTNVWIRRWRSLKFRWGMFWAWLEEGYGLWAAIHVAFTERLYRDTWP